MAKRAKKFKIHGAFKSRSAARTKRRKVNGFILPRNIKGHRRFVVLSKKK